MENRGDVDGGSEEEKAGELAAQAFAYLRPRLAEVIDALPARAWPEQREEIIGDIEARCEALPVMASLHDLSAMRPVWFSRSALEFFGFEPEWVRDLDHSFYINTINRSNTLVIIETVKYFTGERRGSLDLLYCLKNRKGQYERAYGTQRALPLAGGTEQESSLALLLQVQEKNVPCFGREITPEERTAPPPEKNKAAPLWHLWRRRIFEERAREYGLTPREMEVVEYVVRGKSDSEIAESLGISKRTSEKHLSNVLFKCRAGNRRALSVIWDDLPSRYEDEGSGLLRMHPQPPTQH